MITGSATRLLVAGSLLVLLCFSPWAPIHASDTVPVRGVDIGWLPLIETHGARAIEAGSPRDFLELMAERGVNAVRLRLWHSPTEAGHGDLATVTTLARRARALGMSVLLDLHYSDTWADPGRQDPPRVWRGLNTADLGDSVREYTAGVIAHMGRAGALPRWVQLGNEISQGMLWPEGRAVNGNQGWFDGLAQILGQAREGVREGARGSDPESMEDDPPRILIHHDQGGDPGACRWFFDGLARSGFEPDILGVSWYPWWHGDLEDLRENLHALQERYDKPLMILETGYPWTLAHGDHEPNLVGEEQQLLAGYPATPLGQAELVERVLELLAELPRDRGQGLFYWGATGLSVPGHRSPWENCALFDFRWRPLPALDALGGSSSR